MKKTFSNKASLLAAVTVAGLAVAPLAQAESNPFSNTELASGYNFDHPKDQKSGADEKGGEAEKNCKGDKADKQCYNKDADKKEDVINGHSDKAAAEGKCGEGKCGAGMMK